LVGPQDPPLTGSTRLDDLHAIADAALQAVSARTVVSAARHEAAWPSEGDVSLLAVGKAASAMAHAFLECHNSPVTRGLVVGTHGGAPAGLDWLQGAHPVPDRRSEEAARAALDLVTGVAEDGVLVVLVSGGASSLMALAADGIAFEDKQAVTRRLLSEGADITALNCVRKHLSAVKGGRLAQRCRGRIEAWLLSDVVGDDPSVIGSGPTAPDPTTFADALAVLDERAGRSAYPPAVVAHLDAGAAGGICETPKRPEDVPRVHTRVIGSASRALDGATMAARARGYEVVRRLTPITGEARVAAAEHVAWIRRELGRPGHPVCVLASGETTVRVTGQGRGGRNQEFALASALALRGATWWVASIGTDGVDGPTEAAGAWVDGSMVDRARQLGVDPMAYLQANDSWSFFRRVGGHFVTGPTDTNVGDVQIVLVPADVDLGAR
jgi:glycerate 2-kinase